MTYYHRELYELKEIHGHNNVKGFLYLEAEGKWILKFKHGDDMKFDTKQEMYQWLIEESLQD